MTNFSNTKYNGVINEEGVFVLFNTSLQNIKIRLGRNEYTPYIENINHYTKNGDITYSSSNITPSVLCYDNIITFQFTFNEIEGFGSYKIELCYNYSYILLGAVLIY